MRDGNSSTSFVKSCLAFNEVTIPAIPTNSRQLNLYIETAEVQLLFGYNFTIIFLEPYAHLLSFSMYQVALLGGFVSHSDGLINAAVNCLQNVDPVNGQINTSFTRNTSCSLQQILTKTFFRVTL